MNRLVVLLLLFGCACMGSWAMPYKPYQFCHGALPFGGGASAGGQSIDTNYRYPASASVRVVEGAGAGRCDLPAIEALLGRPGCWPAFEACDVGQGDQCLEDDESWYDLSVLRRWHWLDSGDRPDAGSPWPGNPAVEHRQSFQMLWRRDFYRTWPLDRDSPYRFQFLRTEEAPMFVGNKPHCYTMAYLVGFFNGVWNTKREAEASLEVFKQHSLVGLEWRRSPVRYELFYNQSCKRSADDMCLEDLAEVFRQRSAEIDGLLAKRWEFFWEQVTGEHDQVGSFTQRLLGRVAGSDKALASWFDGLSNAVLAKITALSMALANDPPTAQDMAAHIAQLKAAGRRAERAVLVAHSQGNLFANAAYDAYLAYSRSEGAKIGEDTGYVAAQLVHIAPASPTLRGPYVQAEGDLVIQGLRRVDGTYLPASNATAASSANDRSGHKFLSTYLDEASPLRARVRQLIAESLDAL